MRVLLALVALTACLALAAALPVTHTARAFVEAEALNNNPCTQAGGQCLDNRTARCAGGFRVGKCPGAAYVQCCMPPTPAVRNSGSSSSSSSNACAAAGGVCLDSEAKGCSTGFRTGLCPGKAAIQCCIGGSETTRPATPTPTPTPAPVNPSRVTFAKLAQCYPQGDTPDVKKRLGGAINGDWITNTCAIRMSHTLNCAGVRVPQLGGETIRGKAPESWNYIFRVKQLSPQVKKMFGNGVTYKAPTGRGVDVSNVRGKKGIIYFDTTGAWNDATGHFDLWDGEAMVEAKHADAATTERYFGLAVSVTLWQFQ